MKTRISVDPDRLSYTRGGGCLTWLGVPCLLIGLVFIIFPLTAKEEFKEGGAGIVLGFGLFMAVTGAGLAFGRGGTIVDKQRGRVTAWWGVLVPFRQKHTPLAEVNRVAVTGVMRRMKGGGWFTVYYLCLEGPTGKSVKLTYGLSEPNIRQQGVQLSAFLGVAVPEGSTQA
jgi:hypothetical protein